MLKDILDGTGEEIKISHPSVSLEASIVRDEVVHEEESTL